MAFEVHYFSTLADGKIKETTNVCFSALPSDDTGIKSIRYLCPIDDRLNDETVDFYLDFVRKTFTGRDWSFKKDKKSIEFILDTSKNWNKYNVLVYLSAFRLCDESAEIILELYKNRTEQFDTQFIKFQDIHKSVCEDKITLKKNGLHTLNCHGLIFYSPYGGTCKINEFSPIDYNTFKNRLEKTLSSSVHKYFAPATHF